MSSDLAEESALAQLVAAARTACESIDEAVALCREFGRGLPLPGGGNTARRWQALTELGRVNLTAARVFEAHTDALAILAESGRDVLKEQRTWGVFAAEAPGTRVDAHASGGGVRLSGVKPWCSVAGSLDAALVTAHQEGRRRLFAVDLRHSGVSVGSPDSWVARGLRTVTSGPISFDDVPADPVGAPEWYLRRAGFAWGGIGVAACWYGGALGLADSLVTTARGRGREWDSLHAGAVDAALHASGCVLEAAAAAIDEGNVESPAILALRSRAVVAATVESVLTHVGHALGPGPMSFDADHAARVADLTLYVRQHHGERDLSALGTAVIAADA